MQKRFSGLTLVEVVTSLAIISLVSIAAYAGICTAGKFMVRGSDIRREAEASVKDLDLRINNNINDNSETINAVYIIGEEIYSIEVDKIISDTGNENEKYRYVYYSPHLTEASEVSD